MAFCAKCGNNIGVGNFCSSCGTPADAICKTETDSKPKTVTVGKVEKCPSCNKPIESFQGLCPHCKCEISDIGVSKVIIELTEELKKIRKLSFSKRSQATEEYVSSIIIPNNRKELIELAIFLPSQIKSDNDKAIIIKLDEIYTRAMLVLKEDQESLLIIKNQLEKANQIMKKFSKNYYIGMISGFLFWAVIIFLIVRACRG